MGSTYDVGVAPLLAPEINNIPRSKHNDFSPSVLAMFDDIWVKLMMLAKQLRNVMQSYNQKKQELSWALEVAVIEKRYTAIDNTFSASELSAVGSIAGGLLTLAIGSAGAAKGVIEAGSTLGHSAGQITEGTFNRSASGKTRDAEQERAIADLQDKGANSYARTLNELLDKARDIMQQMMSMGRNLVDVLSQILRALSNWR